MQSTNFTVIFDIASDRESGALLPLVMTLHELNYILELEPDHRSRLVDSFSRTFQPDARYPALVCELVDKGQAAPKEPFHLFRVK
jgi:hypothetical protein